MTDWPITAFASRAQIRWPPENINKISTIIPVYETETTWEG